MDFNYKIYVHIFPNNKIYIGITRRKPNVRWNNGKAYNNNVYMTRAIKKYGWENIEHIILYENLTKQNAEQKEIELIKKYKSTNQKFGYNIENGGNHQGKTNKITRKRLSQSHLGKKMKEETKQKISKKLKGTRHGSSLISMKPIDMFDLNGKFIKSYCCMKDCEREMNIPIQHISLCCKNKIKKTHGYIFKYK